MRIRKIPFAFNLWLKIDEMKLSLRFFSILLFLRAKNFFLISLINSLISLFYNVFIPLFVFVMFYLLGPTFVIILEFCQTWVYSNNFLFIWPSSGILNWVRRYVPYTLFFHQTFSTINSLNQTLLGTQFEGNPYHSLISLSDQAFERKKFLFRLLKMCTSI